MNNLSVSQLKQAIDIKEKIESLEAQLHKILGGKSSAVQTAVKKVRRGMSPAGRARIAAAQKARWAKIKGKTAGATKSVKKAIRKKSKMSAAAKAKLSKMMKARWADAKKKGVSLTARKK